MSSAIGRHRAKRQQSTARRYAARAAAGGATLALPIVGYSATGALAAESTYTIEAGDTLSQIAQDEDVEGGWEALYEKNKSVIGDDPNAIQVGDKLSLDTSGDTSTSTDASNASYGTDTSTEEADAVLPVPDDNPTASFEESGGSWSSGEHSGQDWSVPTGTGVKAAIGGEVVTAGWDDSFGYEVVIKHADGDYQQYAHLSQIDVKVGENVGTGDRIALSGATGNVTGPHLHFEVRKTAEYGSAVDPISWLADHGVTANV
ncbi:peptidoglycan DD-metalloendopeptidase family protein [Streptomyces sp. A7024]|uniref:Peptidoglycan DD-metalloendopeptidase family protein n=1 Tax=Streptomyces coryli TaxID=1128680 RepID=A0A6G4U4K8_9ACTN|nr:M23 family metallopeptidase [Streptomyces coryli]NGN66942.1 peptidoglycan DD-metalloendopeptidase family protein [Streptomyces coryli]